MKWTVSEVKKLTHLVNEGHFPDEIAEVCRLLAMVAPECA